MGAFNCVAFTPYVSKQSAKESAKYPVWRTKTSSPGSARLAATKSQPRVPEPEITKGCEEVSVVWKSFRSIERVSPKVFTNVAPTWLSLQQETHSLVFLQPRACIDI